MEMRGGNGYIEDWINARLVRDAHVGVLWEGTSNIAALDAISRAVGKTHAHETLAGSLKSMVRDCARLGEKFRARLDTVIDRAAAFATKAAAAEHEDWARVAAGALYNTASAALMAWEASRTGNGKRLLLARLTLEHRLSPEDPLQIADNRWEVKAAELLLRDGDVTLDEALPLAG
jgi:hypothetical protein